MYHCAGGPATDQFGGAGGDAPIVDPRHDLLSALDAWVDKGIAPQSIIASKKRDGKVVRTRPLCPYPQQAHYVGHGSIDDAANFTCKAPDGGA
jgi:feruloyl esterase